VQQAARSRILRVITETAASRAALELPAAPAGWRVERELLDESAPEQEAPDLLLLALAPDTPGLAVWLGRFRFLNPHCQVLLAESGAEPDWYRAAIALGVDGLLPLPMAPADWLGSLAASAEALGAADAQRRVLGELERSSASLAESRRQLAGSLLQSYEHLGRVHRELERRLEQLSVLYRLGRDLGREQNWDSALNEFLSSCVDSLGFNGVALLLWSFDARRLAVRAEQSLASESLLRALRRLGGLAGERLAEAGVLGLAGDRDLLAGESLRRRLDEAELLALPLAMGDEAEGFLVFRKAYAEAAELDADFHFLKTVQTLLGEAIGGAKALHRLKRLDAFNRSVLESVHAAVLTVDGEGLVSYRNPRAAALFGERLAPGMPFAFDAGFHLLAAADGEAAGLGEQDWIQRECRLAGGEAPERRLLLSVTCLMPRHASEVRHVLVCEDLTEYKRLEAELRQAERLSSLGQLSAGMAHEIRNPLAGIAMTAQVLRSRLGERPDAEPYLERIQAEIQRLERIVRSLLEFSRPARPQLAALDLAASARRVLEDLGGQAAMAGIEFAPLAIPGPFTALADGDQIHQVLLNLVQNAIQACRSGDRVGIELGRAAVVGGDDRLQLRVWDSGPGVPEAARSRLFEPFFTTKAEGTGLGLAVCRQILEEHGGRLHYRPRPGGGAEFCLELSPAPLTPRSEERSA
jgi:signal transduction histidine kinase